MKTTPPSLIWHLDARKDSLQMLRIILFDDSTRIDFGYQMDLKYDVGWWINIFQETHLISSVTEQKFLLDEYDNIVIAPEKQKYAAKSDWEFFTLYFEPLPKVDQVICMIEAENPDQNNFNFYNIPLNLSDALKLREYRRPYGL